MYSSIFAVVIDPVVLFATLWSQICAFLVGFDPVAVLSRVGSCMNSNFQNFCALLAGFDPVAVPTTWVLYELSDSVFQKK